MASDALGTCNLDEFFDFDQLEEQPPNGCHALPTSSLQTQVCRFVRSGSSLDYQHRSAACQETYPALPFQPGNNAAHTSLDWLYQEACVPLGDSGPLSVHAAMLELGDATSMAQHQPFDLGGMTVGLDGELISPKTDHVFQPPPASRSGAELWPEGNTSLSCNTERNAHRRKQKATPSKRRGPQTRLPPEARQILEQEFSSNPYPCSWEIDIIAHRTKLDVKRVRTWFNNTRSRRQGSSE